MPAVNAAKFGIQMAGLPMLARTLEPSDFGLIARAVRFFFLRAWAATRARNAVLRAQETSRELESTVFWMPFSLAWLLCWPGISSPKGPL
jgi:hypothetical protein